MKVSMGNLHFCPRVKHMLGNNPFKGQREFLMDVVALVQETEIFKQMHQYFTYLPGMFDSLHGSMFFKYKFDPSSLYVVYATGQLRKYNLNAEGRIRSYQGSRLTTLDMTNQLNTAIESFNAGPGYKAQGYASKKYLSVVYIMTMEHLLQKAKAGKLTNVSQSAVTKPKSKTVMFQEMIESQKLKPWSGEVSASQMNNLINSSGFSIFLKCKYDADAITKWADMSDVNTYLEEGIFAKVVACTVAPYVHNGKFYDANEIPKRTLIILNFIITDSICEYNKHIEQDHKGWHNSKGVPGLTVTEAGCTNGIESFILNDDVIITEMFEVYCI